MKPKEIMDCADPARLLNDVFKRIHEHGPVRGEDMEILACLKLYHPSVLAKHEESLTYLLGLLLNVCRGR